MAGNWKASAYPVVTRRRLLAQADPTEVESALVRCGSRLPTDWLSAGNQYRQNSQSALRSHIKSVSRSSSESTADFAAASSVLHCADGWSYLGRSLAAIASGSLAQGIHLAYYGELRAALSLLACNGIVVANSTSAVLKANGGVEQVHDQGTHRATWDLLEDWASLGTSSSIIGTMLSYGGDSLDGWLARKSTGGGLGQNLPGLVGLWGLDLAHYATDRDRRNIASYQPASLAPRARPRFAEWVAEALSEVWALIEPTAQGTFPLIDQFLVRTTLENVHRGQHGPWNAKPGNQSIRRWDEDMARLFGGNPDGSVARYFGRATRPPDPTILGAALGAPTPSIEPSQEEVLGVLGRTLILLRLASGMVDRLRNRSGLDAQALRPWVKFVAGESGFWAAGNHPDPLIALWDDGIAAAHAIADAVADGTIASMTDLQSFGSDLWVAGSMERAALWSLCA